MLELIVRLVLGSGLVLAVVLGLRHAGARGLTARGGPTLRVLGRTGLTRSAVVAVVAVDDQRFLVGAADQGVQLLAELGPVTAAQEALAEDGQLVLDLDEAAVLDAAPTPDGATHRDRLPGGRAAGALLDQLQAHRTGRTTSGPRIGPMDRLRELTVRSHLREPIRAPRHTRG